MPKYEVVGYYVNPVVIEVEAENKEEAYTKGYEALRYDGLGEDGEGEWQDDFYVNEVENA